MSIEAQFQRAKETMLWVHSRLDGLKLPGMPTSKRQAMAAACFHVAVEHEQGILVLIDDKVYASAFALMRVLFEAYLRGLWLLHAASDEEINRAGKDKFPGASEAVKALETKGYSLTKIKAHSWSRLCSYTHTGYQQIGARLTPVGLGYDYKDEEVVDALTLANNVVLLAVIEFAQLADSEALARQAMERLRALNDVAEVAASA